MGESLKHFLGICGESHINIYWIILIVILLRFNYKSFINFYRKNLQKNTSQNKNHYNDNNSQN